MTRDEIVQMAHEVGIFMQSHQHQDEPTKLERFAELVAKAERRECVIACEGVEQATESQSWVVANCVEDILARGKI